MTPGARFILADYMQPRARRIFDDKGGILPTLRDAHYFDCNEIMPIARMLAHQIAEHGSKEILGFLPAPLTWLEWKEDNEIRGVLLCAEHGATKAAEHHAYWHASKRDPGGGSFQPQELDLVMPAAQVNVPGYQELEIRRRRLLAQCDTGPLILALLACINTPRIIGRKTHLPAGKLQRAFARNRPMSGKFPIGAWTQLLLRVTPPRVVNEPSRPGYLTGARAQHFVRCHLRVRMGMLELVVAHHRGDPSLGIKRTRYRLAA